jgi:polysaccharide deacetylase family protein (PEP-CTERM system associated)
VTPTRDATATVNAFSIDVEDWFQVAAFEGSIARENWDTLPCRVERNIDALLGLLEARGVKATFFTLGWVAERYPQVVRGIAAAGHEVASHGYGHQRAFQLTPQAFREDGKRAKDLLETLAGSAVLGYRAPSFSIGPGTPWAFDALEELGFVYSSSVYPVQHDLYGAPDAPRFAHAIRPGLLEIPPSTVRLFGRNLPASGGGFFRLLPYPVSRWCLRRVNRIDRQPSIFYCHPWEIDPQQPRVAGAPMRSRLRHYLNLSATLRRLDRLLTDLRWDRVDRVFAEQFRTPAAARPAGRMPVATP